MSSKKILTAAEIRAELAYRRIQATNLAAELGNSYSYLQKILHERRQAPARLAQITEHLGTPKIRRSA